MAFSNEITTVEKIPGRKIIVAKSVGKTSVADMKWFTDSLLDEVAEWKETGWVYMADISRMSPVFPPESAALIELTKTLVAEGCKALAFVEGKASMIRIQAHSHTERAATGVLEGHFKTKEEALEWIAKELHM